MGNMSFIESFKNRVPHINPNFIIILVIALAIPLTVILSQKKQDIRNFAAEKDESVLELSNAIIVGGRITKTIDSRGSVKLSTKVDPAIIAKAQKRKELMLKLANEDPYQFLLNALPAKITDKFSPLVKENTEQEIILAGKLIIIHIDDFKNGKSRYEYRLNQVDNKKLVKSYVLHFAKSPPAAFTDSTIAVKGYKLNNELVVLGGQGSNAGVDVIDPSRLSTTGDQKTLFILVNFQDDGSQTTSKDELNKIVFTDPKSVVAFYKENSYNKTNFTGDIVGYFTLPYNNSDCVSKLSEWTYATDVIVKARGVDIDSYPRLVYVASGAGCNFAGYGMIGGNPSRAWISANYSSQNYRHIAHELGHNLGLNHANFLDCGSNAIGSFDTSTLPSTCTSMEYGDMTDVMGSNYFGQEVDFNAPHKIELGWLDPGQIFKVTDNTTINLSALETTATGYKSAQISIPNSTEYYDLSFRKAIGFDSEFSSGITQGVSIHLWKQMNQIYDYNAEQTQLIDTTPLSDPQDNTYVDFLDSSLSDGATFNDSDNGITVKQMSHTIDNATVDISIDKTICRRRIPDFSIDPTSQISSVGQSVTYNLFVKNNDLPSCAPTTFKFSNPGHASFFTYSPSSITLAPGDSGTVVQIVTPPTDQPVGNYILQTVLGSDYPRHTVTVGSNYILSGFLNSVKITPQAINTTIDASPTTLTALAYDINGQPITTGVNYEWSRPDSRLGTLMQTTGSTNTFTPTGTGIGIILVFTMLNGDTAEAKIPLGVFTSLNPTPPPTPTPTPSPISPTPTPTSTPIPTPTPTTKTLKLTSSADSYVRADQSTKNFGTAKFTQADSIPNTISFIKFNLSPLSGKKIIKATLSIKVNHGSPALLTLKRGNDNVWTETRINFNNKPGNAASIKTFNAPTAGQILQFDIKNAVNTKKGGNLTLVITSGASAKSDYASFFSHESTTVNRPQLIIQYR